MIHSRHNILSVNMVFATLLHATVSNAAALNSDVPQIVDSLTNCVGQYEAAKAYTTYVDGYAQDHRKSSAALQRLLAALQIDNTAPYLEAINEAARAFEPKIFEDPLNTRSMLASTIS